MEKETDKRIDGIPFVLWHDDEKMSIKVEITLEPQFSDHSKLMGEASVILEKEYINHKIFFDCKYQLKLVFKKIKWFEQHEGFENEVTDEFLIDVCDEIAQKMWDE